MYRIRHVTFTVEARRRFEIWIGFWIWIDFRREVGCPHTAREDELDGNPQQASHGSAADAIVRHYKTNAKQCIIKMTNDNGNSDSSPLLRVAVGSSNPCKIRAVHDALETVLQKNNPGVKLDIVALEVPSGVRDQPMENEETRLGAENRCRGAFDLYESRYKKKPDLAVGLEGGLEVMQKELWSMAWMAICGSRSSKLLNMLASKECPKTFEEKMVWGYGKAGSFLIPPEVSKLIQEQGMELGDADDQVFGRIKSKHGAGTVGLLTDYLIDRSHYYQHALILALVPWIRPDAYP